MEGPLQMSESGKPLEMFVILFDDMLLISRRKKALSKKVECNPDFWVTAHLRGLGGEDAFL